MTHQSLFTTVATHLLVQNAKSMDPLEPESCAYRGANGLKCGIGILIPDDKYSEDFEHRAPGTSTTIGLQIADAAGIPRDLIEHARTLQRIHDIEHVTEWKNKLQSYAERHELTFPTVVA